MENELKQLSVVLTNMDNDPRTCLMFFRDLPDRDAKYNIFENTVKQVLTQNYQHYDSVEINVESEKFMDRLNYRFFHSQKDYCWQSHMCHFHMNIRSWINCPQTCIAEIKDFVDKLLKGD